MSNHHYFSELVSTAQLSEHLGDSTWVLFDCRFDLQNPSLGANQYRQAHIPGALYAHLNDDLSSPVGPSTGRHPLPDVDEFSRRLSVWGVGPGKQVVIYDTGGGTYAARMWWMLQYLGHSAAALLDGGYAKWTAENRPLSSDSAIPAPARFTPHPNPSMLIGAKEVAKLLFDPTFRLVDARSPQRFRGENETVDPIAGHIPGAVNRFYENNLNPDGTLSSKDVLRSAFQNLVGDIPTERTIVYCGSGVTACHHVLAMRIAGLGTPRLYAGSWSEWIRDPDHPIVKE